MVGDDAISAKKDFSYIYNLNSGKNVMWTASVQIGDLPLTKLTPLI